MEKVKLDKKDWERVKNEAEIQIKQALIMLDVNRVVLETAEAAIARTDDNTQDKRKSAA